LSWNVHFINELDQGLRLPCPKELPDDMYDSDSDYKQYRTNYGQLKSDYLI